METVISVEKNLDLRGQPCPVALAKIKSTLNEMESGMVLEVLITDQCTQYDIPTLVKRTGNNMLKTTGEEEAMRFLIQKKE
jgi:tRNA 2-thiouridine synthesizing protein A